MWAELMWRSTSSCPSRAYSSASALQSAGSPVTWLPAALVPASAFPVCLLALGCCAAESPKSSCSSICWQVRQVLCRKGASRSASMHSQELKETFIPYLQVGSVGQAPEALLPHLQKLARVWLPAVCY